MVCRIIFVVICWLFAFGYMNGQLLGTIGLDKTYSGDGVVAGITLPLRIRKLEKGSPTIGFGYRLQLRKPLFYHSSTAGPQHALIQDSVFAMSTEQNFSIRQKTDFLNFYSSVEWMPVHLANDRIRMGVKGMLTFGKLSDMFNVYAGLKEDAWVLYMEPTVSGQVAWHTSGWTFSVQGGFSAMVAILEVQEVHYRYPYYYYLSWPDLIGGIWSMGVQLSVPLHRKD